MLVISPEQCRAARGWLRLTQHALALSADISKQAVIDFEKSSRAPMAATLDALQSRFERGGIHSTFDEEGMPTGLTRLGLTSEERSRDATLTPEQCRAGRGWLDWTQQDLATYSGVGLSTIRDFEREFLRRGRRYNLLPDNLWAIQDMFTDNGVHFLFTTSGQPVGIQFIPVRNRSRLVA